MADLEAIELKIDQLERNFEAIGGAINTGALSVIDATNAIVDLRDVVARRIDELEAKIDQILVILNGNND